MKLLATKALSAAIQTVSARPGATRMQSISARRVAGPSMASRRFVFPPSNPIFCCFIIPTHLLLALMAFVAPPTRGFSQGLVNFQNTPSTLISIVSSGSSHPIDGPVQSYFFALLTSPVGSGTFSFAGVYATNTLTPGIINGGAGVAIPGWTPGTALDFAVAGWPADAGVLYNPSWLKPDLSFGSNYPMAFGVSQMGMGAAGGATGNGTFAPLDLFGGPTGIQNGFILLSPVPEPSNIGIGTLGAVLLVGSQWYRKRLLFGPKLKRRQSAGSKVT